MMGKLSAWRGDRKDATRAASSGGMGGLVSIEQLNAREDAKMSRSKVGSLKKPKLHLRRRSFGRNKSPSRDPNNNSTTPPLHNESIFSNFPALDNNGPLSYSPPPNSRVTSRRPSVSSEHHLSVQSPENRPRTADPHLARRRSKTAPSGAKCTMAWDDKPLPLAIDMDAKRKEMGLLDSPERKNSVASLIVRPRTAESGLQSRITRSPSKGPYSLMPSLEGAGSRRGSKSTISPVNSNSSTLVPRTRSRANSQTTPTSARPSDARNSILDEVEGTLTATITELQELQGTWHQESRQTGTLDQTFGPHSVGHRSVASDGTAGRRPSRTASRDRSVAQHTDSYFPPISQNDYSGTHSMPHTPMKAMTFADQQSPEVRLISWQHAYNEQKKHAHAILMENDDAKKRLEFMKARLNEFEDEKSSLVRSVKEAEDNLQTMLGRLREAKVGKRAAQNEFHAAKNEASIFQAKYNAVKEELDLEKKATEDLRLKLEEVNTQKVDLLEHDLEARQEYLVTKRQLEKAVDVLKNSQPPTPICSNLEKKLEEVQRRNAHLEAELKKLCPNTDLPSIVANLTFKNEDMARQISEKDALIATLRTQATTATQTIRNLERTNSQLSSDLHLSHTIPQQRSQSNSPVEPAKLASKLSETQDALRKAHVERDQLATLLHAEIRRTTVDEHGCAHPSGAFLRKKLDLEEAVGAVRARAQRFLEGTKAAGGEERTAELEREIEYYLNDIVLYKLDVKGYRKDLRRAKETISELSGRVDREGSLSSGTGTVVGTDKDG